MWLSFVFLYSMDILLPECSALNMNNLPIRVQRPMAKYNLPNNPRYMPRVSILRNTTSNDSTVHAKNEEHKGHSEKPDTLINHSTLMKPGSLTKPDHMNKLEQNQDYNLKKKIATLVDQTIHDTEVRMGSVQYLKDGHKTEIHYKVGFLLSMIKKTRDMLNELFHVAVKHRDDWKALEETKILELIVHTNVDTTNLVKQLMDVHSKNPDVATFTTAKNTSNINRS